MELGGCGTRVIGTETGISVGGVSKECANKEEEQTLLSPCPPSIPVPKLKEFYIEMNIIRTKIAIKCQQTPEYKVIDEYAQEIAEPMVPNC